MQELMSQLHPDVAMAEGSTVASVYCELVGITGGDCVVTSSRGQEAHDPDEG